MLVSRLRLLILIVESFMLSASRINPLNFSELSKIVNQVDTTKNSSYEYQLLENTGRSFQQKTDILSHLLKIHIDRLRNKTDQVELIFLVDASGSIGPQNFRSELSFVRKLLADFTVEFFAARVAIVTFGGKRNVNRNVDQISKLGRNHHKCFLFNNQLSSINYTGGGTYTRGALLEALAILEKSRETAKKVVFLITDGFSNGGNPRSAANLLKNTGATIFTFGIRTGNIKELHDIASSPGYAHSYLLDSFTEFEALARRALHRDLKTGKYIPLTPSSDCDSLCFHGEPYNKIDDERCCDSLATCSCGTATGHYACICPIGYFGSGRKGFCQPCPNGTYASGYTSGDSTSVCVPCPDTNHVTIKMPAMTINDCVCAFGFATDGRRCEVITCPKLKVPENGYLVKANACNNVVNAACGIRCRIGFQLSGDSIRLCGENGVWSGNEPQCFLKTCPALRAPLKGRIRCFHDDFHLYQMQQANSTSYPIDTRCQFKCDFGYQLKGSKIRNCLPLSRWDGLEATCKEIKCEPLKRLTNGKILPERCTGPEKVVFATNCTISCKNDLKLEGPKFRFCGGRSGVWSQRRIANRCIDNTPPVVNCPSDIVLESLPGKNYAYVNWSIPQTTDNTNDSVILWSKPNIIFPWKVKIGNHNVAYVAQDLSGNKAICEFRVKVLDKESPTVENCIESSIIFVDPETKIGNIYWDEPGFYDNSKLPVRIQQSHRPGESIFSIGNTKVVYNAIDVYGNIARCVLNITVEDICESFYPSKVQVERTCKQGYELVYSPSFVTSVDEDRRLKCISKTHSSQHHYFSQCYQSQEPEIIYIDGSINLEGETSLICGNFTILHDLYSHINKDLKLHLTDVCDNDITCNLTMFDPECTDMYLHQKSMKIRRNVFPNYTEEIINNTNKIDRKRKQDKIEIKFKFIGKIIKKNMKNPQQGLQKLREKILAMIRIGKLDLHNNRTNYELAKLALNLHLVFEEPQKLCSPGSILRKDSCIKCPFGTFHNSSISQCQSCPFGQYQNATGAVKCKYCPLHTSTTKMHAKSLKDCIPICRPGYYSQNGRHYRSQISFEPCYACEISFYQPKYGQNRCLSCPMNKTTKERGSNNINDCISMKNNVCKMNSCLNNGKCIEEKDGYSCECPNYYIGAVCEIFQSSCISSPCLNEGKCNVQNMSNVIDYNCTCKNGYVGTNCELYNDECRNNPCQNQGRCMSTENDYSCMCNDGFEGDFCEIALNYCHHSPCQAGSTCSIMNETWQCLCMPGYLGRRCNQLPCDWLPCHPASICINIEDRNTTRNSYRCECPEGYYGENCTIKIDYCESLPCRNHGECKNLFNNYTCICHPLYIGYQCEIELTYNYVMQFTKSGTTDYAIIRTFWNDLSQLTDSAFECRFKVDRPGNSTRKLVVSHKLRNAAHFNDAFRNFTMCVWLQSVDKLNYGTVFSYATYYQDNTITVTDYNGIVLYVNGYGVVTDVKVNDGLWHFVCIAWENVNGTWEIFLDGVLRDHGINLATNATIQGNGSLVIGQEQDRLGGGFSESEAFLGNITLLDFWDVILEEDKIAFLYESCEKYFGTILAWPYIKKYIRGDVTIFNSTFCSGCTSPILPFNGNINFTKDLSKVSYYCEPGYIIKFDNKEYRSVTKKCLKQGQWEDPSILKCTRVNCDFPGYFPRGYIHGWSYYFGDEIYYSCMNGYELHGNPRRICKSDGKWSGLTPICIGITCKSLLAPEHGDIEYILEEYERDDVSFLQVGQQLEFKCDPGFRLIGEKYLMCLESGKWDYERPSCVPYECSPPEKITHGHILSSNMDIDVSDFKADVVRTLYTRKYFQGDILEYACDPHYKFESSNTSYAIIKLECSNDGSWLGALPKCILVQCSWPNPVEEGRMFLHVQNNTAVEIPMKLESKFLSSNSSRTIDNLKMNKETKDWKHIFIPGTKVSIVCNAGYSLIGENIRVCTEEGTWTSKVAICEQRKCSLSNHIIVQFFNYDVLNKVQYKMLLKHNKADRKWGNNKSMNGSYRKVHFYIEGDVYGKRIIVTCRNESVNFLPSNDLSDNITWTCDERGDWKLLNLLQYNNESIEKKHDLMSNLCEGLLCPALEITNDWYTNVNLTNTNVRKDDIEIFQFKCKQGYMLEGSGRFACLSNGSWSKVPSCKRVSCTDPLVPANTIFKKNDTHLSNYTVGDVVMYKCAPGYRVFGSMSIKCLQSGKWSRIRGKCFKISCGKPKIPPEVLILGPSYLFQDRLEYICPNGQKGGVITCKSNGQWSHAPLCIDEQFEKTSK